MRIIYILFILVNLLFSQNIYSELEKLLSKVPYSTEYSIYIYNLTTDKPIFSYNIDKPLKPASLTKLYTTAVSIMTVGINKDIKLSFYTNDKNINDGIIRGNLYIKGFGNPLVTDNDLKNFVDYLKRKGIKQITGNIIYDESFFDTLYNRIEWIEGEPNINPIPPVSSIILNRNILTLSLQPTKKNKPAIVQFKNSGPYIKIINNTLTRKNTSISVNQTVDNSYVIRISGTLSKKSRGYNISDSIKNPSFFTAAYLANLFYNNNISFNGRIIKSTIKYNETINIYNISSKLEEIISIVNKRSDNFIAECLFKINGAYYSGIQGNSFYSTQAVNTFLRNNGIFSIGTDLVDGSGLSHYNRTTTKSIVELLKFMYLKKSIFPFYYESLSIASEDGTLRHRFYNTDAEKNFHGKTGTLNGVSALSGYVYDKNNHLIACSIIWHYYQNNAHYYKNIEDKIINLIIQSKE